MTHRIIFIDAAGEMCRLTPLVNKLPASLATMTSQR
ncbi:hypothetical protein Xmau_01011 [Xenorhabdus mauleonii]|uniref:Uncharacterized protein n=1 Tax=Xenorhabdus mauleonii TaxID=351675 RepID=A0A1I3M0H0_9GAMM|nr:hypothetical protein Xmau_01011 [Xenorhabdus mauleonii]SFI90458.1 hypothetical protein SAMN05421680_104128 [Xenorhabdus mauleonii]